MDDQYLTVKEFAAKLKLHYNTVLRAIKNKRINTIRIGYGSKAAYRIPISELERISLFDLESLVERMVDERLKEKLKL